MEEALHWAVTRGDIQQVRLLVSAGADISGRLRRPGTPADLQTPLQMAAERGHASIVQLLLDLGAEVNALDDSHSTVLHSVASRRQQRYLPVVQLLLQYGANPNARDELESAPLHAAAANNGVAIVELLLTHGAHPLARDQLGRTPLLWAASLGHPAVLQMLLQHVTPCTNTDTGDAATEQLQAEQVQQLLAAAATAAAGRHHMHCLALLAKQIVSMDPGGGSAWLQDCISAMDPPRASEALAALVRAWLDDVRLVVQRRAALQAQQAKETAVKLGLQQLLLGALVQAPEQ